MTSTPQNTSNDIQLCKSCYCMTHDSQDNPGHCGKCGAERDTSNSGSESNSPEIDGIKTLRRVLLEFDQSRAKTCISAAQGDIDRTEADAQLEQSLANAIAAIHRLYIKRSDVVEAINHAASSYDYEDGVGVAYGVANGIKARLGLSGEQEDKQ